jgi:hypothetical protein
VSDSLSALPHFVTQLRLRYTIPLLRTRRWLECIFVVVGRSSLFFWCLRTETAFCGLTMRQLTVESLSRSHPCPRLACIYISWIRSLTKTYSSNPSFAQTRALLVDRTSYRLVFCLLFGLCLRWSHALAHRSKDGVKCIRRIPPRPAFSSAGKTPCLLFHSINYKCTLDFSIIINNHYE